MGVMKELDQRTGATVKQMWSNEQELKTGLDSSEFNLRAHQKVLNALALEVEEIRKSLDKIAVLPEPTIKMTDVVLPPADPSTTGSVVRRLDWAYYHGEVEKDLAVLAQLNAEKRQKEEAEQKRMKALEEQLKKVAEKAKADGNDPAEVEAAAKELLERTQRLATELGKAARGEPYDKAVIEDAEKFIAEVEAKEGSPEGTPPPQLPEGAAVFGE